MPEEGAGAGAGAAAATLVRGGWKTGANGTAACDACDDADGAALACVGRRKRAPET